jgi:flavin-dependent dehydrogenase
MKVRTSNKSNENKLVEGWVLSLVNPDVFISGAGPAGLAAGISAARAGFSVEIADCSAPPIDKACGEGLMPDSLAALAGLGVELDGVETSPFHGVRFIGHGRTAEARFPEGTGLGVRRTVLHPLLLEKAESLGVRFRWKTTVRGVENGVVKMDGATVRPRWVIGADGHQSRVRHWAGLERGKLSSKRIGLRQHYGIAPWSKFVEIYWGEKGQAYVTPVAKDEICVAYMSREKFASVAAAQAQFPELNERLGVGMASDAPRGAVSLVKKLQHVAKGNVALIGDASGSIDAITGEGMAVGFRQAAALTAALKAGDLKQYEAAHKEIGRLPHFMSEGMLMMDRVGAVQRHVLKALAHKPELFGRMLKIHVGHTELKALGRDGVLNLGLGLLTA